MQCKVFILAKSSVSMPVILFTEAKKLGMMSEGYVWIMNEDVTSLLDSIASLLLQGKA